MIYTVKKRQLESKKYFVHIQALDVVEALLEMRLDGFGVFGLTQDLQKVVVGQEVESGEDLPLGLQVHIQGFLDLFQLDVHIIELLQQTCVDRHSMIVYAYIYINPSFSCTITKQLLKNKFPDIL